MTTWLVGVTVGVAVRLVVLGHYRWNELAFLAVALVFNGVVAWPFWWMLRRARLRRV